MLVGTHDGRVEHHELFVGVPCQHFKNTRKHAAFAPSAVSPVSCFPVAVALGKITLRNARAITENHGVDEQPIVQRRPSDMALAAGQHVLDSEPLVVAQSIAMHLSASLLPTTHESEKK